MTLFKRKTASKLKHKLNRFVLSSGYMKMDARISHSREEQLRLLGKTLGFSYRYSDPAISAIRKVPSEVSTIQSEVHVLSKKIEDFYLRVSDIAFIKGENKNVPVNITILSITNIHVYIPIFSIEKYFSCYKYIDKILIKEKDNKMHPSFSETYNLRGISYSLLEKFFTIELQDFLQREGDLYHIESSGSALFIYKESDRIATFDEVKELIQFGKKFIKIIYPF